MARKPGLQEIFMEHFDELQADKDLTAPEWRAARAIMNCRTEVLGGHEQRCPDGHYRRTQYHSCKHRSCPRCAERRRALWLEEQKDRLLPCDHFHVIFTVPHELVPLGRCNRREFAAALFEAARDTLLQLLGQERHLGATPGILLALHTWGRQLNLHPHVHGLVTAGGFTANGEWRDVRGDYLLPAQVLKAVYRGRLLARLTRALENGDLREPGNGRPAARVLLRQAAAKTWNVRIQSRYGHGHGVATYLSRYVAGGPIANTRVVAFGNGEVRFRYRDHREGRWAVRRLPAVRFAEAVLRHVPEPGQHMVRHVGLYAHACRVPRERCRALLGESAHRPEGSANRSWQAYLQSIGRGAQTSCPHCGMALVRGIEIPPRKTRRQISPINVGPPGAEDREGATRRSTGPAAALRPIGDPAAPPSGPLFLPRCGPVN